MLLPNLGCTIQCNEALIPRNSHASIPLKCTQQDIRFPSLPGESFRILNWKSEKKTRDAIKISQKVRKGYGKSADDNDEILQDST